MSADEAGKGDNNGAALQTPATKRGRGRPKRKAVDDDAEKSVKRERVAADDDDEDAGETLELPRPTRATRGNSVKTAIKTEDEAETGADAAAAENEADGYVDCIMSPFLL